MLFRSLELLRQYFARYLVLIDNSFFLSKCSFISLFVIEIPEKII